MQLEPHARLAHGLVEAALVEVERARDDRQRVALLQQRAHAFATWS
jgi:hypothetical protein